MKKTSIALIILMLLLAVVIAGCGEQAGEALKRLPFIKKTSAPSKPVAAPLQPSADDATITGKNPEPAPAKGLAPVDSTGIGTMDVDLSGDCAALMGAIKPGAGKGVAKVFMIDPVETPEPECVILTDLDGSGYLRGEYIDVQVVPDAPSYIQRVQKSNHNFVFDPILPSNNVYFRDAVLGQGEAFDQASLYYHFNEGLKWYKERFGFEPKDKIIVKGWCQTGCGGYDLNYNMVMGGPERTYRDHFLHYGTGRDNLHERISNSQISVYRDARVIIHELTHLVQRDRTVEGTGKTLPANSDDKFSLIESFAKYMEAAYTNTPADEYYYSRGSGIKDWGDYEKWTFDVDAPPEEQALTPPHFVIASTWWHIRQKIGAEKTDKIVYECMGRVRYDCSSMVSAKRCTVESARALGYGRHVSMINKIFAEHGIREGSCAITT